MIRPAFFIFLFSLISVTCFSQDQNWRAEYDSCKFYFNKGDFAKASVSLEKLLPVFEKNIEDTSAYYEMKNILAVSYLKTGKAPQAEPLFKQTINYYHADTARAKHSNHSTALIQLAVLYYGSKKFQEAEPLFKSALDIQRKTRGEKNQNYITLLNNLATIETNLKKFDAADSVYQKILSLKKEIYGSKHPEYISSLNTLATTYKNTGRIKDAETIYLQTISILKDTLGENHPEYGASLNNLATLYKNTARYSEAEPLYIKVLAIKKHAAGDSTADYASSLTTVGLLYKKMGKFSEAEPMLLQAMSIYKKTHGEKNIYYATSLNALAGLYRNIGHYSKSENLYKEAEIILKETVGENHPDYIELLHNMALLQDEMGHYETAETLYKRVLETTKSTLGERHPEYAASLNNLAYLYQSMGHYDQAEPIFKQALQIRKEVLGEKHMAYGESLNNLASLYQSMGRNKEAETLYQQALVIFKNIFGEKHPEYALFLNNLAGLYETSGQYTKSETLYSQSLQIIKETLGEHHPDYATTVNNLALLYQKTKKLSEAEKLYKEDLEIVKTSLGVKHPKYASSLSNLAVLYEDMGRYKEAENFHLQVIDIRKNILGNKHPDYAVSINNLARLYTATSRMDEAEKLWAEAISNYLYQINTYFPSMSEKEKEQFYNTIRHKFEEFNSFALLRAEKNPAVLSMMYNNQLATKALLLNASNKLRERILSSGDANLITAYKKWQSEKELLAQVYTLSKEERTNKRINIDSLEIKANELEKELSLKSELFKKTNEKQNYKWEDIQKKLKPSEAAIEIIRFFKHKADSGGTYTQSVYYAALIVKQSTIGYPELVVLKNGKDLEERYIKFYRNSIKFKVQDEHAYVEYWGKIKEALPGITKIYISPDGVYNQINLYSIRNQATKQYILDEIEIETVTNTKDLLQPVVVKGQQNKIILLGNPAFYPPGNTNTSVALPPLPATSVEVQTINDMMKQSNWSGQVYTGQIASEENVKEVKDARVLHIATHGFFQKDIDNTEEATDDDKSENPLLRSGLMLAGSGQTSYENKSKEDGILTAFEAMNLNLDNTDLVVLSACETGLGEIKNGEGVYGLQRAFRVAGAKSIIISLWKIDDATTQKLMVYFYQEWLKTNDKREAFKLAQAKIRKEFSDPYYWGAFIMIGE